MATTNYDYERFSIFDIKDYPEKNNVEIFFVKDGWQTYLKCKDLRIEACLPKIEKDLKQVASQIWWRNYEKVSSEQEEIERKLYQKLKRKFGVTDKEAHALQQKFEKGEYEIKDWDKTRNLVETLPATEI